MTNDFCGGHSFYYVGYLMYAQQIGFEKKKFYLFYADRF